jgi:hypothetical protein
MPHNLKSEAVAQMEELCYVLMETIISLDAALLLSLSGAIQITPVT